MVPIAISPQGPTFWAKFSNPRVGPLRGSFKKISPYRGFFLIEICLQQNICSVLSWSHIPRVLFFGVSHCTQRRSLVCLCAYFLIGYVLWWCFSPSQRLFLGLWYIRLGAPFGRLTRPRVSSLGGESTSVLGGGEIAVMLALYICSIFFWEFVKFEVDQLHVVRFPAAFWRSILTK
jgi:hypothetical protein